MICLFDRMNVCAKPRSGNQGERVAAVTEEAARCVVTGSSGRFRGVSQTDIRVGSKAFAGQAVFGDERSVEGQDRQKQPDHHANRTRTLDMPHEPSG
jgi:hypothetical protein